MFMIKKGWFANYSSLFLIKLFDDILNVLFKKQISSDEPVLLKDIMFIRLFSSLPLYAFFGISIGNPLRGLPGSSASINPPPASIVCLINSIGPAYML
jgi:hypothetical protein